MKGRGLSFIALSPSPDPASLAFDAVMVGATILGPLIKSLLGTGHLEANQITPVQNKLHTDVLAPAVDAKDNPATPVEDLIYWRDTLQREGEAFFQFTQKYGKAGPGARQTILGIQDAAGNWITTATAPGYLTQILRDLVRIIAERTVGHSQTNETPQIGIEERTEDVNQQLGIDWTKLAQIGVGIAAGITGQPVTVGGGGQVVTGLPPSQRPGYVNPYSAIPDWAWPVGIGLLALLLLTRDKR